MAQTLKFGNKTWATKVGSTLAYNDENGNFKPLPFAFTRSTSATRVNKEGLIEVVTNDRPRIDYTDTSDGVLLLEKAATNLIQYSEDFSDSSWSKTGISVISNNLISPNGTLNASKIVENSLNSQHKIQETSVSITAGNVIFSQFIKKDEVRSKVMLEVGGGGGSAKFDLDLGVVITENGVTAKINSYKDNWYRCSVSFTPTASSIYIGTYILDNNLNISYQGDGSSGVYIWGSQVEAGNLSSYIPTQGSATTRVAETASGSGNSEVFNDSEGVLFANIAANANDGTYKFISISDGTTSNRVSVYFSNLNKLSASVPDVAAFSSNVNIKNNNKVAFKYKSGGYSFYVNGFELGTSTSTAGLHSGLNTLNFDFGGGSDDFYGKTKEIGYYNTILTDLELETLTSYKSWTSMVNELNLNIIYNG